MTRIKTLGLAGAAALALAGDASAAVVTFDTTFRSFSTIAAYGSHYQENGLAFDVFSESNVPEQIGSFGYGPASVAANTDPDGAAIFVNASSAKIILSKVGGGTFTLNTIDLADAYNATVARQSYDLNYSYVDGSNVSHSGVINLDSIPGLQTFSFDLTVLSFTMFTGNTNANTGPGVQLDNVVFDQVNQPPGVVPEPTTWALMIGGLGLAGATLRRRRAVLG